VEAVVLTVAAVVLTMVETAEEVDTMAVLSTARQVVRQVARQVVRQAVRQAVRPVAGPVGLRIIDVLIALVGQHMVILGIHFMAVTDVPDISIAVISG
jgi:hypothetical protein